MGVRCRYCFFNAMIWVLILVGVCFAWVNWLERIPSTTIRIIAALIIVLPIGALLQWFILWKLGWNVIKEGEKGAPGFEERTKDVPYSFATAFGTFERSLYLALLLAGKPEALFLWLGFKAITKWGQPENSIEWKFSKPFNLSLVGELTNIFLALVGILLIKGNTKALISHLVS
jgi:hypothetical protein